MEDQKTLAVSFYELIADAYDPRGEDKLPDVKLLRSALQYISASLLEDEAVRFPNLFSRIEYLCRKYEVKPVVKSNLHRLRLGSNRNSSIAWSPPALRSARAAVAQFVKHITGIEMPVSLQAELIASERKSNAFTYTGVHVRAVVRDNREGVLYLLREDDPEADLLLMHKSDHLVFEDTFNSAREGDLLSLIDVSRHPERVDGFVIARLVVYQPDYLVDVSALAACFMNISNTRIASEALWFINRLSRSDSSIPLFLGNLANNFFDALVNASDELPSFKTLFAASFGDFPLEYVRHFPEDAALLQFMTAQASPHYTHLKRVVSEDLKRLKPPVPRAEPLIEPSFMSPELGLQGRLDLLHLSGRNATIIELKSGKLPWPPEDPNAVNESHAAQARMYQMLVNRVLDIPFDSIHIYLLYSSGQTSGSNLRYVARFTSMEASAIALRNSIVLSERAIADALSAEEVMKLMRRWNLASCKFNENARVVSWFADKFEDFQNALTGLSALKRDYLCAFMTFISREQWLARLGDGSNRLGHSALWNKNDADATDAADRLGPMSILENRMADSPPRMQLKLCEQPVPDHDFRRGDICVLYPSDHQESTAVQRQVIKAYLVDEPNANGELTLGFRNPQHHKVLFESYERWSIEHDYMDQSFSGMQRELFSFVSSSDRMQKLLLGTERPAPADDYPEVEPLVVDAELPESQAELRDILSKAIHTPDYFLLVGPPGTGKTSMFLSNVIRALHDREEELLLLAYTNRAVDEICEAVETALGGGEHYLRIGSSTSSDPRFEGSLLHKLAGEVGSREELKTLIRSRRVVVSTVSSILSRQDIFALKHFDRIIVDEASQVLEPLLVNLLRQARRFILIGDDKQLPAVVQQSAACNRMLTESLRKSGLLDLRASLFERMLHNAMSRQENHVFGTLTYQGRMHPVIGGLVGEQWYGGKLHPAGRPHQLENSQFESSVGELADRLVFIDAGQRAPGISRKVNPQEATVIATWVALLSREHQLTGDELAASVGVIAPYRNQIGRIKNLLGNLGIDGADRITVDTVERYQGSQRDFIIYGTTVTSIDQLRFLAAHTRGGLDGESEVDRKLNVAVSRARKQFVMVGTRRLLEKNPQYSAVIDHIERHGSVHSGVAFLSAHAPSLRVPF